VIDSGLFHVFSDDLRWRYVQGLAQVIEPGGRLFLMCGSTEVEQDTSNPVLHLPGGAFPISEVKRLISRRDG
jgi:hypothetical protein